MIPWQPGSSERLASIKNVTVLNEDVLKVDPASLLDQKAGKYKVVANLPYYITSPVLRHFLEASAKPQMMVVMVQKEVADQITASPGRLSILAVSVQLYGKPALVTVVPAASFYPVAESRFCGGQNRRLSRCGGGCYRPRQFFP